MASPVFYVMLLCDLLLSAGRQLMLEEAVDLTCKQPQNHETLDQEELRDDEGREEQQHKAEKVVTVAEAVERVGTPNEFHKGNDSKHDGVKIRDRGNERDHGKADNISAEAVIRAQGGVRADKEDHRQDQDHANVVNHGVGQPKE